MQFRSILTPLVAACLALVVIAPASAHRVTMSASSQSVVANLNNFIYTGDSGTITIEKDGQSMDYSFGANLSINGKNWKSYSMIPQENQGPPVPSPLKLHCSLLRLYYSGHMAYAIKVISNNGSRYFC